MRDINLSVTLDKDTIKLKFLERLENFLWDVFPQGSVSSGHFRIGNLNGEKGSSLAIKLHGEKAGCWIDHATGEDGNVFHLFAEIYGLKAAGFITILQEMNLWLGNPLPSKPVALSPQKKKSFDLKNYSAQWNYTDEQGNIIAQMKRYDTADGQKEFLPYDCLKKKWAMPNPRFLYNLHNLKQTEIVIFVEGEKCADALIRNGFCATTIMGGANASLEKTDWSPLKGKEVIIWPDNDEPGHAFSEKVSVHLQKNGASKVKILLIPSDKPKKWDAADAEAEGVNLKDFIKECTQRKTSMPNIVRFPQARLQGKQEPFHTSGINDTSEEFFGEKPERKKIPEWCEKWCYVDKLNSYVDLKRISPYTVTYFNNVNGVQVPGKNRKPSAAKYVADNGFIQCVARAEYLPTHKERFVEMDGEEVLNLFRHNQVPSQAKGYTRDGLAYIERLKKHLLFICNKQEYADVLHNWMAHQTQLPGKKIRWAPVIQGIEGIGKSFFGTLLSKCLGAENVGTVFPQQVTSSFNGWSKGVCVNVLEELRIYGLNRHEAVNALKPLITNEKIQVNEKNVKQYQTTNVTNYICFTNHKDSIPLGGDDRRWWVIFNQVSSHEELKERLGGDPETYFSELFDGLDEHWAEVKKWLMEHKIPETFLELGRAPHTEYKECMITTEVGMQEGLQEMKELIEEGDDYFCEKAVSSSDLFKKFKLKHPEIELPNQNKKRLLLKLGYLSLGTKKIDGFPKVVWAKIPLNNDEIRAVFRDQKDRSFS